MNQNSKNKSKLRKKVIIQKIDQDQQVNQNPKRMDFKFRKRIKLKNDRKSQNPKIYNFNFFFAKN